MQTQITEISSLYVPDVAIAMMYTTPDDLGYKKPLLPFQVEEIYAIHRHQMKESVDGCHSQYEVWEMAQLARQILASSDAHIPTFLEAYC